MTARSSVGVKDFVSKRTKREIPSNIMLLGFLQATLSSVPKDDILIISCSHIHNRKVWVTWRCSAYINNGQCLWRAAVFVFFLSQMKNWDSESTLWKGRWNPNSSSLYTAASLTGFQLFLTRQEWLTKCLQTSWSHMPNNTPMGLAVSAPIYTQGNRTSEKLYDVARL